MNKVLFTLIAAAMLLASPVFAGDVLQQVYEPEDSSPALRFKNISPTLDVQVFIEAGDSATNSVTVYDTTTVVNTIVMNGGNDTIAEIAALFAAATNYSGKPVLEVDADCSLAADSTDDELLDAQTVNLSPGGVGEIVWDTSVAKFFSCYVPNSKSAFVTPARKEIDGIFGLITGTGSITVNIYKNGTEVFSDIILSPQGTPGGGTNVTDEVVPSGLIRQGYKDFKFGIGLGENTMIRATRATTATTGGIGANVRQGQ